MQRKRSIFINGSVVFILGILCLLVFPLSGNSSGNQYIRIILSCMGFVVALSGQFLRISARGYKSQMHNTKDRLITDGPYSMVRNPMYLGSFLIGLGVFLCLFPWWILPVFSAFFLLWYAYQIHIEQHRLKRKFGSKYSDYCKQVPAFFPKRSCFFNRIFFQAFPFKFAWIDKEWNTIAIWASLIVIDAGCTGFISYSLVYFLTEISAYLVILLTSLFLIHVLCKPVTPVWDK